MHFPPEIFPSIDNDQKGGTLALFPLISPSISSEFSPLFFQFVPRWRKISLFHLHSPRRSGSRDHFTNTTTTNSRPWFCPSKCISWSKEISRLFFWSCHLHIATLLTELWEGASRFLFFQPGLHEILLHRRLFPKGKGGVGRLELHLPPLPLPNGDDGQDIGFNFSFLQLDEHESRRPGSASGKQKKRELVKST